MELKECITIERYKLVTSRQIYLVDLVKEIFSAYAKTLAAFIAGSITLVSTARRLEITPPEVILDLIGAIAVFLSFAALISISQIIFCMVRWREYRLAECKINPDAPIPEWWAYLFEAMYALAITASVGLVWWGYFFLESILARLT